MKESYILIWEGRPCVRPGPILPCEHHFYPLITCGDGGNDAELWFERKIEGFSYEIQYFWRKECFL